MPGRVDFSDLNMENGLSWSSPGAAAGKSAKGVTYLKKVAVADVRPTDSGAAVERWRTWESLPA